MHAKGIEVLGVEVKTDSLLRRVDRASCANQHRPSVATGKGREVEDAFVDVGVRDLEAKELLEGNRAGNVGDLHERD